MYMYKFYLTLLYYIASSSSHRRPTSSHSTHQSDRTRRRSCSLSRWARVYDASYWRLDGTRRPPRNTALRCLRQLHADVRLLGASRLRRARSSRAVWNNWTRFIAAALITRSFSTGVTSRCQPQMYFRLNIRHTIQCIVSGATASFV